MLICVDLCCRPKRRKTSSKELSEWPLTLTPPQNCSQLLIDPRPSNAAAWTSHMAVFFVCFQIVAPQHACSNYPQCLCNVCTTLLCCVQHEISTAYKWCMLLRTRMPEPHLRQGSTQVQVYVQEHASRSLFAAAYQACCAQKQCSLASFHLIC